MAIELKKPQLASSEIPNIYTQVTYPKIIQPKLDGIACLAVNGVAMSRTMKPIPNHYVQRVFKELNLHGLHGELMVNGDFNDVQSAIMREVGEPDFEYWVYDSWDKEQDYETRYELLREEIVVSAIDDTTGYSDHVYIVNNFTVWTPEECDTALTSLLDEGYEGVMLRDPVSPYKQGRHTLKSQALMKLKKFYDDEAIVIGFEEKLTNTNAKEKDERGYSKRSSKQEGMVPANTLGALVVSWGATKPEDYHKGEIDLGVEFKIGSGYTDAQRQEIWDRRDMLLGKFVTFKYQELSKYGVPRFPVWKCFREEYNV